MLANSYAFRRISSAELSVFNAERGVDRIIATIGRHGARELLGFVAFKVRIGPIGREGPLKGCDQVRIQSLRRPYIPLRPRYLGEMCQV